MTVFIVRAPSIPRPLDLGDGEGATVARGDDVGETHVAHRVPAEARGPRRGRPAAPLTTRAAFLTGSTTAPPSPSAPRVVGRQRALTSGAPAPVDRARDLGRLRGRHDEVDARLPGGRLARLAEHHRQHAGRRLHPAPSLDVAVEAGAGAGALAQDHHIHPVSARQLVRPLGQGR
jgi:hypothetical protein